MIMQAIATHLRQSWYLVLLMVLCFAGAAVMASKQPKASEARNVPPVASTASSVKIDEPLIVHSLSERTSSRAAAEQTIAEYETRLNTTESEEEKQTLLLAMGNLSRQKLGDYQEAARYYSLLIAEAPDRQGLENVYAQLGVCYEQSSQVQKATSLYREMLSVFPEGSEAHLFAESKLYKTGDS